MYDKKGRLTHAGAQQVINEGGSVLHGGKLYTSIATLPHPGEFAKGDKEALKQVRKNLDAQIKALAAQRAALDETEEEETSEEPVEEVDETPAEEDLQSLKKDELLAKAQELGLEDISDSMTKAQIIEAIENAQSGDGEQSGDGDENASDE